MKSLSIIIFLIQANAFANNVCASLYPNTASSAWVDSLVSASNSGNRSVVTDSYTFANADFKLYDHDLEGLSTLNNRGRSPSQKHRNFEGILFLKSNPENFTVLKEILGSGQLGAVLFRLKSFKIRMLIDLPEYNFHSWADFVPLQTEAQSAEHFDVTRPMTKFVDPLSAKDATHLVELLGFHPSYGIGLRIASKQIEKDLGFPLKDLTPLANMGLLGDLSEMRGSKYHPERLDLGDVTIGDPSANYTRIVAAARKLYQLNIVIFDPSVVHSEYHGKYSFFRRNELPASLSLQNSVFELYELKQVDINGTPMLEFWVEMINYLEKIGYQYDQSKNEWVKLN